MWNLLFREYVSNQRFQLLVAAGGFLVVTINRYLDKRLSPLGTIYRSMIRAHLVALLFGQEYLLIRRSFRKMIRYGKISLDVYIAADDPQSYVLLQALAKLKQNYDIHANILILDNNLNAWATSRDIELAWCVKDSALFACVYNLNSPQLNACSRSDWAVRAAIVRNMIAKCILNASSSDSKIISSVLDCMDYLWGSKWDNDFIQATASIDTSTYDDMFVRNKNRLLSHGYYGPGMIEMEREFYGPSRLHHLERRLLEEYGNLPAVQNIPLSGIDVYMHNNNSAFNFPTMIFNKEIEPLYYPCDNSSNIVDRNIITNQNAQFDSNQQTNKEKVKLYFSFRSPYSQLVLPRLLKMCQYYNVEIEICPLMPMVLRGLAVPVAKEEYITSDVVRESRMWNIPFGCIVDPIFPEGKPIFRIFCAYLVAQRHKKEIPLIIEYSRAVWGEGYDIGTDYGLKHITDRAGLDWVEISTALRAESGERELIEKMTTENKLYVQSKGFWGVPCIEYKNVLVWGQDKLWVIEILLKRELLLANCNYDNNSEMDKLYNCIYKYFSY